MTVGGYAKIVTVVVLAAVLMIDGYLAYRFYSGPRAISSGDSGLRNERTASNTFEDAMPETTMSPDGAAEPRSGGGETLDGSGSDATAFVHRATRGNTFGNSTYIDHPLADDHPNAFILVTFLWEPQGDAVNNEHEIGVWYDGRRGGKWAIYNQDLARIPVGTAFNVVILEGSGNFVHRASAGNIVENSTYLDHPLTDGQPDAMLSVTQNWNPPDSPGTYNDHPVGAWYDTDREKWAIYNRDLESIPEGSSFNVAVSRNFGTTG